MYKNVLRSIEGIEIYPVISLLIFTLFFTGLIVYVIKMSKPLIKHMEDLPLELDEEGSTVSNNPKELAL